MNLAKIAIPFFILILLHLSCLFGPKENDPDPEDYRYPLAVGNTWKYVSTFGYQNCTTMTGADTLILRAFNIDTALVTIDRIDSTKFDTITFVRRTIASDSIGYRLFGPGEEWIQNQSDGLYDYGFSWLTISEPLGHILKYPYQKGISWDLVNLPSENIRKSKTYLGKENVVCPAGSFLCYKIQISKYISGNLDGSEIFEWISPEIGLVGKTQKAGHLA